MRAEIAKLRRTFVPAVVVAWPATTAFLVWALLSRSGEPRTWEDVTRQGAVMWGALLLPLLVALLAAQVLAFEHGSGAWRWWGTLPRRRWRLAAPKVGMMLGLVLLASLLAALALVPVGLALGAGAPGRPGALLQPFLLEWGCALGYATLLLALAFRFPSFLVPTGVGGMATVVGVFAMQSDRYGPWWPWSAPVVAVVRPELVPALLAAGAALAAASALGLVLDFGRRDL